MSKRIRHVVMIVLGAGLSVTSFNGYAFTGVSHGGYIAGMQPAHYAPHYNSSGPFPDLEFAGCHWFGSLFGRHDRDHKQHRPGVQDDWGRGTFGPFRVFGWREWRPDGTFVWHVWPDGPRWYGWNGRDGWHDSDDWWARHK